MARGTHRGGERLAAIGWNEVQGDVLVPQMLYFYLDDALAYVAPRAGSALAVSPDGANAAAWLTGTEYRLKFTARRIPDSVATASYSTGRVAFESFEYNAPTGVAVTGSGSGWAEHWSGGTAPGTWYFEPPPGGYGVSVVHASQAAFTSSVVGIPSAQSSYIEKTYTGLTPGATYTVTVRMTEFGIRTGTLTGMKVNGTAAGMGQPRYYEPVPLRLTATANGSGELVVQLGIWDHTGALGLVAFDRLEIWEDTPAHAWFDGDGWQAFLVAARDCDALTFYPDATNLATGDEVTPCYLMEPIDGQPEPDGIGRWQITVTLRNPTTPFVGY